MEEKSVPLAAYLGQRVRALREQSGLTTDELAKALSAYGFAWQGSRVRAFEAGRATPTVPIVFALTAALGLALRRPLTVAELLSSESVESVAINEHATVASDQLADAFRDLPASRVVVQERSADMADMRALAKRLDSEASVASGRVLYQVRKVLSQSGETGTRAAADLNMSVGELAYWSVKLWGTSIVVERDKRAGDGNAQVRGRVMRQLKDEVRVVATAGGSDGNR